MTYGTSVNALLKILNSKLNKIVEGKKIGARREVGCRIIG
jgi:hypothetical protein